MDWESTRFTKGYTIKNAGVAQLVEHRFPNPLVKGSSPFSRAIFLQNFNFKKMPKNKKYIIITADINDGDYITSINQISDETLTNIMPVIEAIKKQSKKQRHNFTDALREIYEKSNINRFDQFCYLLPGTINDDDHIHTIKHITILDVLNETKLL